MKKYLILLGITALAMILLFILGGFLSFPLLNLTASIVGERLTVLGPLEPSQFWVSIGILFTSCGLGAMLLYLVHFFTQSPSFSMPRYSIYLATSIIGALTGIGFRLLYFAIFSGGMPLYIRQLQFLQWGLIVNFLVCGIVAVLLVISRTGTAQARTQLIK